MFKFYDTGKLIDDDLELVLTHQIPGNPVANLVPVYHFEMQWVQNGQAIGSIDLRVGNTDDVVLYAGHIGYGVEEAHRGHRYAARSCRLLFPLALRHGLTALWITCNPDNAASARTCELAGAELVEVVDLPPDTDMYQMGERQKCRYRIILK